MKQISHRIGESEVPTVVYGRSPHFGPCTVPGRPIGRHERRENWSFVDILTGSRHAQLIDRNAYVRQRVTTDRAAVMPCPIIEGRCDGGPSLRTCQFDKRHTWAQADVPPWNKKRWNAISVP